MAKTQRHDNVKKPQAKRSHDRDVARKLVRDFERQYIARNQDPHIYL